MSLGLVDKIGAWFHHEFQHREKHHYKLIPEYTLTINIKPYHRYQPQCTPIIDISKYRYRTDPRS